MSATILRIFAHAVFVIGGQFYTVGDTFRPVRMGLTSLSLINRVSLLDRPGAV